MFVCLCNGRAVMMGERERERETRGMDITKNDKYKYKDI